MTAALRKKKIVINDSRFDGVRGFKLGRYTHDAQIIMMNCTFSKNMADQNIYQAKPDVQWGHRIYYHNCSKNGSDYDWYRDNFTDADFLPAPEFVTPLWAFNGLWDPNKYVQEIMNNILK
jgi:pectinesterase